MPGRGAGGRGQGVRSGLGVCTTSNLEPWAAGQQHLCPVPPGPRRPCQTSPDNTERRQESVRSETEPGHAEEVSGRGQQQQDQTGPYGWVEV